MTGAISKSGFDAGAGDLNAGPHIYTACTLSSELSPQPCCLVTSVVGSPTLRQAPVLQQSLGVSPPAVKGASRRFLCMRHWQKLKAQRSQRGGRREEYVVMHACVCARVCVHACHTLSRSRCFWRVSSHCIPGSIHSSLGGDSSNSTLLKPHARGSCGHHL